MKDPTTGAWNTIIFSVLFIFIGIPVIFIMVFFLHNWIPLSIEENDVVVNTVWISEDNTIVVEKISNTEEENFCLSFTDKNQKNYSIKINVNLYHSSRYKYFAEFKIPHISQEFFCKIEIIFYKDSVKLIFDDVFSDFLGCDTNKLMLYKTD